jgi:hypothetical protein
MTEKLFAFILMPFDAQFDDLYRRSSASWGASHLPGTRNRVTEVASYQ